MLPQNRLRVSLFLPSSRERLPFEHPLRYESSKLNKLTLLAPDLSHVLLSGVSFVVPLRTDPSSSLHYDCLERALLATYPES